MFKQGKAAKSLSVCVLFAIALVGLFVTAGAAKAAPIPINFGFDTTFTGSSSPPLASTGWTNPVSGTFETATGGQGVGRFLRMDRGTSATYYGTGSTALGSDKLKVGDYVISYSLGGHNSSGTAATFVESLQVMAYDAGTNTAVQVGSGTTTSATILANYGSSPWVTGTVSFSVASGANVGKDIRLVFNKSSGGVGSIYAQVDTITGTFVPEPATMALLGLGGIGLILSRKRK